MIAYAILVAKIVGALAALFVLLWVVDWLWRHAPKRHSYHGGVSGGYAALRRWTEGGVSGEPLDAEPSPKIGRNERCPCGSGKKFKRCHGPMTRRGTR